jgi:hypothetical protein
MNINLHIERLVLDGISLTLQQRASLKAAVVAEIKRQLANQGIGYAMQSDSHRRSVRGGSISIDNLHKPASIGKQIGNAVYRGIGK